MLNIGIKSENFVFLTHNEKPLLILVSEEKEFLEHFAQPLGTGYST